MSDVLVPSDCAAVSGDGQASERPRMQRAGWEETILPKPVPPDSFRTFVETHQHGLYALAVRLTGDHNAADDLVQETFVKAWRAMEGGTVPETPTAWLRRIATHQFLNTRRGSLASRMVRWADEALHRIPDASPPPPDATFPAAFAKALNLLSDRERAVFVLRHLEDQSTREAADALGVAEGTVKALLSRAVAKLQTALKPYA